MQKSDIFIAWIIWRYQICQIFLFPSVWDFVQLFLLWFRHFKICTCSHLKMPKFRFFEFRHFKINHDDDALPLSLLFISSPLFVVPCAAQVMIPWRERERLQIRYNIDHLLLLFSLEDRSERKIIFSKAERFIQNKGDETYVGGYEKVFEGLSSPFQPVCSRLFRNMMR